MYDLLYNGKEGIFYLKKLGDDTEFDWQWTTLAENLSQQEVDQWNSFTRILFLPPCPHNKMYNLWVSWLEFTEALESGFTPKEVARLLTKFICFTDQHTFNSWIDSLTIPDHVPTQEVPCEKQ